MHDHDEPATRRDFLAGVGMLASAAALAGCATPGVAGTGAVEPMPAPGGWDLSWMRTIERATDKAVFDWPSLGDPADSIVLQIAERFLDNCGTVYGGQRYTALAVLNIRTQAVPAALRDAAWVRFGLGEQYNVKDPNTKEIPTRNPFLHPVPSPVAGLVMPTVATLMGRGSIALVCDFAMGHMARRLATRLGRPAADVHDELKVSLIPGAFLVPSGIFGLARAQNSGCAYVRM